MSHSTTATATHILSRYSRSYPSTTSNEHTKQHAESQWQHFVNPVIRLVLDVKKSSNNELESFRLRVVWCMGSGKAGIDIDKSEVVFEDLDLLSFSSLSSHQPQQAQGLPLKAVYREAVVGIRYLHPITSGCLPAYRRFQMNFISPTAASQFIDSICNVCPCKANPPLAPGRNIMTPSLALAPSFVPDGRPSQIISMQPLGAPSIAHSALHSVPGMQPPSKAPPFCLSSTPEYALSSSPIIPPTAPYTSLDMDSSSHPPSSPSLHLQSNQIIPHDSHVITATTAHQSNASGKPIRPIHSSSSNNSSIPESSPPVSSLNSNTNASLMPPPPLPSTIRSAQPATDPLLECLREIPTLYDLPRRELEELVADVVREEGFLKLLETLDSMWKVKGFLGR